MKMFQIKWRWWCTTLLLLVIVVEKNDAVTADLPSSGENEVKSSLIINHHHTTNHNNYDRKDINEQNYDDDSSSELSVEDQMKLMSKQLSALMNRRREDYKLLETNLKKYVKTNAAKFVDDDIQNELERLR